METEEKPAHMILITSYVPLQTLIFSVALMGKTFTVKVCVHTNADLAVESRGGQIGNELQSRGSVELHTDESSRG